MPVLMGGLIGQCVRVRFNRICALRLFDISFCATAFPVLKLALRMEVLSIIDLAMNYAESMNGRQRRQPEAPLSILRCLLARE